jgi:beta-glucosidase
VWTMALKHSQRGRLAERSFFFWATGIEDTFITDPHSKTGRTLDEYELTDHYARFKSDIGLMTELGVPLARYGIPWHRIQPSKGRWQLGFPDRALEELLARGIDPIVDLVHYGLPRWIEGAYLHPSYPDYVAEYAARIAERFRGRIHWYTPLNEPRITAWYCGKIGWWPPYAHGWRGFVRLTLAICRGIVRTVEELKAVDPQIVPVHVDAADLYASDDPTLAAEVRRRQEIVFLNVDLITGRVGSDHPLRPWLLANGATELDLAWFEKHAIELPIIGFNLYPMFTDKRLVRGTGGVRAYMRYSSADIVERMAHLYWQRYQTPLFVSETASVGAVSKRRKWLFDSVAAVRRLRERGVGLVGYTWWPMFALVTWGHRQGLRPVAESIRQMGLWDLDESLERVHTPLVDDYRALVAGGHAAVGEIATSGSKMLTTKRRAQLGGKNR